MTHVFAHRFVVRTEKGTVLADLGPRGAEKVALHKGDHADLRGEMKPSELKVARIAECGAGAVAIGHGKPGSDDPEVVPTNAVRTVEANGFAVVGVPGRKPKNFEILGRDHGGDFIERHDDIDGTLRKSKPIAADDAKWAEEMEQAC